MKKLVYLLILSLCANGLAGAFLPWPDTARAASKTEEKSEKQSDKKSKKDKAEKKTSKEQSMKSKKSSKKTNAKDKKTKVEKEKEYALDLAKNGQVALSVVLKYTKMGIKLKDVKSIELADEKDKKRIRWEKDEDNEGDYILTVLKDFKELRLRIVTKKASKLLVLKNGAKNADEDAEKAASSEEGKTGDTKAPSGEKPEKSVKESKKAADEEAPKAPAEETEEAPSKEKSDQSAEESTEKPTAKKSEKPTDENEEAIPEAVDAELEALELPTQEQTEVEDDKSGKGKKRPEADAEDVQFVESIETVTEAAMDAGEGQDDTTEEQGTSEKEQQGEGQTAPTEGQEAPGEEQGESGEDQAEPTEEQEAPGEEQGESGEDQAEPIEEQEAPGEEQGESGEGEAEPTEEQEAPGEEQGESGEGEEEPTEEQEAPGEEQGESGEGEAEPTEEQEDPGEEQSEDSGEDAPGSEDPQTPEDGSGAGDEAPRSETGASIPEEAEAWFKRGTELLWGSLKALVAQLTGGETVYIQTDKLMLVKKASTQLMSTVTLLPDGDAFKGSYSVCISTDNPALVAEPALLQPADLPALGDVVDLYIWVKLEEQTPPEGEEPGEEEEKPTLVVTATGFEPSGWSTTQPQFTLSGIPEDKEWSYAAIIYDERIVPIASNVYAPDEEGIFTVRFAMLNELGDIMAASEQYTLQLDWTAPEVSIELDEETSYTLNISATDKASGLDAVSVDKGKTWEPIDEDGYTVTEEEEKTFKAGAIRVRDVAGNVYKSEEEYTLEEVEGGEGEEEGEEEGEDEGGEGGGGGGGGGGNGSGTPALPHSRGDGEEGVDYDALILDLPDEPMEYLTVGGEPMELTLALTNAQAPDAPVGENQPFTGRLCHWKDASNDDAPNTLLLEAEIADDLGDVFTYEWRFNGEVYRMLANSGIKYVALKVDDTVAAFPTEGFTGGTRYTELKMQGVSTRKFDYTLAMKLNLDPSHVSEMNDSDFSQECDLSILAKVEDTNYELSNSPQSMMYFYNVFLGPEDMMDQPFGEYRA